MVELDCLLNSVIYGDCIEVLAEFPDGAVDMILTDPPYVCRYRASDGRTIAGDVSTHWILPAFRELYRVLRDDSFCVTTYGWNRVDSFMRAWRSVGFRPVGHFVWVKSYSSLSRFTNGCHEMAYLLAKGEPEKPLEPLDDVLRWTYSGNLLHPTQKAVRSLMPFIRVFSKPGDIVLDPFAGAASTAVAALACGRRFIAIEMLEEYYRIASARVARWKEVFGVR
jgi:site-specific DNA-methyltransferase (adenine-specific)